jgi:serralysin
VLRYRFINGDSTQRARMRALFAKADAFVGLAFKEVTTGNSDCRVAFNPSGHWSYVGTQNKRIAQNQQTMNIQLSGRDSDREWYRVGMHEIFHWLGLQHEHQHPRHTIDWIRSRVYQVYGRTQGWSVAQINYQVLNRPTSVGMDGTPTADKESLMMYPIDRELVSDPSDAVGWNYKESVSDRIILKRFYPF